MVQHQVPLSEYFIESESEKLLGTDLHLLPLSRIDEKKEMLSPQKVKINKTESFWGTQYMSRPMPSGSGIFFTVVYSICSRPSKCLKFYTNRILGEQNWRWKVRNFCPNLNCDIMTYLIKYTLTVQFSISQEKLPWYYRLYLYKKCHILS